MKVINITLSVVLYILMLIAGGLRLTRAEARLKSLLDRLIDRDDYDE